MKVKILLSKGPSQKDDMFQWSVDGRTWLNIHMDHIEREGDGDISASLERLCTGRATGRFLTAAFEGHYDHTRKVLILKKAAMPAVK
jgi:hypothetical protein